MNLDYSVIIIYYYLYSKNEPLSKTRNKALTKKVDVTEHCVHKYIS